MEKMSSVEVANIDLMYWSVRSCSRRGGDGIKVWMGGIVILASSEYHFIRVHEKIVQHQSNNIVKG